MQTTTIQFTNNPTPNKHPTNKQDAMLKVNLTVCALDPHPHQGQEKTTLNTEHPKRASPNRVSLERR